MQPCSIVQLYNFVTLQPVILFFLSDIKLLMRVCGLVWHFTYT